MPIGPHSLTVHVLPRQVTFAWPGFNNAMASNVGMVVRNILSKKLMGGYKVQGRDTLQLGTLPCLGLFCCDYALFLKLNYCDRTLAESTCSC